MTNYQQGCRHKITDWSGLGHSLAQPGGKTQVQLAALWGEGVTQQNIRAARQKLGISRKKRPTAIKNAMHSSVKPSENN